MILLMELYKDSGCLMVKRETGDKACRGGGWTSTHGWGAEHQLMYRIKKRLNACGFHLIKKRMQNDGHLCGDTATPYLRAANKTQRFPHIYIYDNMYAVRNSAEDFNSGEEVSLSMAGNIWDIDQPDWANICSRLCTGSDVICERVP